MAGAMLGEFMSAEAHREMGGTRLLPRHGALILAFKPAHFAAGSGRDPIAEGEQLFDAIAGQGRGCPRSAAMPHGRGPRPRGSF
ncbi:hypothetical protein ACFSHQ_02120 [Gemmobacter lanyuensis]